MNVAHRACTREAMPHFPPISQDASGTLDLPTRQRDEHNEERPQFSTTDSTERASRLRIQTRRRRYLALNPSYFDGSNLEQAGLLYSLSS